MKPRRGRILLGTLSCTALAAVVVTVLPAAGDPYARLHAPACIRV